MLIVLHCIQFEILLLIIHLDCKKDCYDYLVDYIMFLDMDLGIG